MSEYNFQSTNEVKNNIDYNKLLKLDCFTLSDGN